MLKSPIVFKVLKVLQGAVSSALCFEDMVLTSTEGLYRK